MILNASGCLDAATAPDVAPSLDAYVTKTVTPLPRGGNAPVRIAETETGMLNSIGLANPGLDRVRAETLPALSALGVPVWVSVGGFSARDYARSSAALDREDVVAAIELNLSCPNVAEPDADPAAIVRASRAETAKPLYAKLSPAAPDIAAAALEALDAGADGLSLVNTLRGLVLDRRTLRPALAAGAGGLSGPALRAVALAAVYAVRRVTEAPIVAIGGIETGRHALDAIAAGASAVALGTVLFSDPTAPARIRSELEREAASHGFANPLDAKGCAHASERLAVVR